MPLRLSQIVPRIFTPPQRGCVVEFARKHHRITVGSMAGPFDPRNAPYQIRALEAIADPVVRILTLRWASQSGKSKVQEIALHYRTANDPGPAMWVLPEAKARRHLVEERLDPAIHGSPDWKKLLVATGKAITHEVVRFVTMSLILALAQSSSDLSQKTIRHMFLDEQDKYPPSTKGEGSTIKQAEARQRSYPHSSTTLNTGTPTTPDGPISRAFEASSQEYQMVPCPHCEKAARWDDLRIRTEEKPEGQGDKEFIEGIEAGNVEVWYECPECCEKISEESKGAMNQRAYWVAERPWIKYHIGLQLHSLSSPFTTFRSILVERLEAELDERNGDDRAMQHFVQHQRGLPWSAKGSSLEEAAIMMRCSTLKKGIVPRNARYLTRGIDVQHDRLVFVVKAWDDNVKAHFVDWGIVPADLTISFKEFNEIVSKRYFNEDKNPVPCVVTLADSGDGKRYAHVYKACLNCKGDKWAVRKPGGLFRWGVRPCKGQDTLSSGRFWGPSRGEEHGDRLVLVNTMTVKQFGASLLSRRPDLPNAVSFAAEARTDIEFQRQMVSEELVKVRTKSRNEKLTWQTRPGYQANHYFDASTYADAGAICFGVIEDKPRQRVEYRINRAPQSTLHRRYSQ